MFLPCLVFFVEFTTGIVVEDVENFDWRVLLEDFMVENFSFYFSFYFFL